MTQGPTGLPEGGKSGEVQAAGVGEGGLQLPPHSEDFPKINTLDDLHQFLIKLFGKENGDKIYNYFEKSMIMGSLSQIRESAERAKRAAKEERQH